MNIHSITYADEQWHMQIQDEIDALPEAMDMLTPFDLGVLEAECGAPFAPEVYFANHHDKCNYAEGWASIKGSSYLTDYFLLGHATPAIEDDHTWITQGGS
jgi:hypothetical protein